MMTYDDNDDAGPSLIAEMYTFLMKSTIENLCKSLIIITMMMIVMMIMMVDKTCCKSKQKIMD